MSGMASRITSPSALTTKRKTPWVLGCCGPILRVISSVAKPALPSRCTSTSKPVMLMAGHSPQQTLAARADAVVFLGFDEVFAQRVADPVFRHQQPAQVRVVLEGHAEQIEDLALGPVGRLPH